MSIGIHFEPKDIWVGVFWDVIPLPDYTEEVFVYICLLPCLPICIRWERDAG